MLTVDLYYVHSLCDIYICGYSRFTVLFTTGGRSAEVHGGRSAGYQGRSRFGARGPWELNDERRGTGASLSWTGRDFLLERKPSVRSQHHRGLLETCVALLPSFLMEVGSLQRYH